MFRITRFIITDLIRNWILLFFTAFLLLATVGFFMLDAHPEKALLGVMNTILLVVPMVSVVFATIYYYNSQDFMGMLLALPLKRYTLLLSIFFGLSFVFCSAVILGTGIPLWIMHGGIQSLLIVVVGALLAIVFVAFALLGSVLSNDKARGMGIALMLWAYFVLLFDGLVLFLMYYFSDYPIEKWMLSITFLNPVDLSRIVVLMQTEASALMGASGAVFENFFSEQNGSILALGVVLVWAIIPLLLSIRIFNRKNI